MKSFPTSTVLTILLFGAAACGGGDTDAEPVDAEMGVTEDALMDTTPAGTPAPPALSTIREAEEGTLTARLYEWEIELSRDTVDAGLVTFRVTNTGSEVHAFEVEGGGMEWETENIEPGDTATLTVTLRSGEYEVYCPVVGEVDHQERGMTTTLYVRG